MFAKECEGTVQLFPEYAEGLKDIEGFSHIILLYRFHFAPHFSLLVKPFLEDTVHGVFATRSPQRPNAIGLSVVRLIGRKENVLKIAGVDILDGTLLIDIKPYSGLFDRISGARSGWHDAIDETTAQRRGMRRYKRKQSG